MSLLEQPDTTHIHKLTVRGPSGTRQRLLPQLESGHWPAPTDGSWVLVRQVAASAGKNGLAVELLEKARRQISIGDPSEVVRFASLAALLAALITDISMGVASQHWYWQRWSRLWPLPAGDAIQQAMQEYPRQLVSVCHHLASSGNLATVWQCLSAANGSGVLSSLGYELGLAPGALHPTTSDTTAGRPGLAIPSHQLQIWRPIVASLPETDPRSGLASLVVATDSAALALRAAPAHTMAIIRQKIVQPGPDRMTEKMPAMSDRTDSEVSGTTHGVGPQPDPGENPSTETHPGDAALPDQAGDSPAFSSGPGAQKTAGLSGPGTEEAATGTDMPGPSATNEKPDEQGPDTRSGSVRTDMGGALYLLNVLNRPPMQAIMEQEWQSLPNGWAWLYHLARELELDGNDALCDFLAERLGLESVKDLESLPPLPERPTVLSLAAQWFRQEDLWSPSLIRVPGELTYTPGHLDLYMDNSQVQLELRLAGLDLNPGWLPWLGTVVTFHFDHFPHLRGATS